MFDEPVRRTSRRQRVEPLPIRKMDAVVPVARKRTGGAERVRNGVDVTLGFPLMDVPRCAGLGSIETVEATNIEVAMDPREFAYGPRSIDQKREVADGAPIRRLYAKKPRTRGRERSLGLASLPRAKILKASLRALNPERNLRGKCARSVNQVARNPRLNVAPIRHLHPSLREKEVPLVPRLESAAHDPITRQPTDQDRAERAPEDRRPASPPRP